MTDNLPIQFINPETNRALNLSSQTSVRLQTNDGSDDRQLCFHTRSADSGTKWEIHRKGLYFKVASCAEGAAITTGPADGNYQWKVRSCMSICLSYIHHLISNADSNFWLLACRLKMARLNLLVAKIG